MSEPRPAHCQYCDQHYKYGDTISGVRLDYLEDPETRELVEPGTYYEGHYQCVVKALGPRLVDALQSGALPTQAVVDAARITPRT
jgi:hypothetical protein